MYKRSLPSEKIEEGDGCTQDRYASLFANELEKILLDYKITALSVNKYVPQALKQTLQKSIMNFEKLLVVAFLRLECKEATTKNKSVFVG